MKMFSRRMTICWAFFLSLFIGSSARAASGNNIASRINQVRKALHTKNQTIDTNALIDELMPGGKTADFGEWVNWGNWANWNNWNNWANWANWNNWSNWMNV